MSDVRPQITELHLNADPGAWAAAGFELDPSRERLRLGSTVLGFDGSTSGKGGLAAWTLGGVSATDFDGLPTAAAAGAAGAPAEHPNTAFQIDHLVVFTPDLERTIAAFEAAGVRCRRIREVGPPEQQLRQAFFRFGEVIAEVVQVPADQVGPDGAARFWGLTVTVTDLDFAVAELGELVGSVRDAVQPGRRIATIRKQAGLGLPVALITPEPPRQNASAAAD
ncbi:MAG: glyoxalase [Thermoleophilia bacterium]|nr:glyoxalase [Thermoleophilia bacterium]